MMPVIVFQLLDQHRVEQTFTVDMIHVQLGVINILQLLSELFTFGM
jgi:hypothetical protein